jgi:2-hydroxychromene-2-carboxylate isomerase
MLTLYYDVVCPFAYAAFLDAPSLAREAGVELDDRPFLLGGLLREVGSPDVPADSMSSSKRTAIAQDAMRALRRRGVSIEWPAAHPRRTVNVMRLILAAPQGEQRSVALDCYESYWVRGEDVTDMEVLRRIGHRHGLDADHAAQDPVIKARLRAHTREAAEAGAFGAPSLVWEGKMYWGVDRIPVLREALGLPRTPPKHGGVTGRRVVFFHDVSSPYSYLAAMRLKQALAPVEAQIEWCPMLLGALFKTLGGPLVPIASYSPARQAYLGRDLEDQAAYHGIDFRFSSHFPIRSVKAQRVQILNPETTEALYRAAWVEDRDLGDAEVLNEVLNQAGFDGQSLLEGTQRPEIKEILKANTERAVQAGACGAPTFVVGGGALYWGQDRLDHVFEHLSSREQPNGVFGA